MIKHIDTNPIVLYKVDMILVKLKGEF